MELIVYTSIERRSGLGRWRNQFNPGTLQIPKSDLTNLLAIGLTWLSISYSISAKFHSVNRTVWHPSRAQRKPTQ
jgi:hypothetical protein